MSEVTEQPQEQQQSQEQQQPQEQQEPQPPPAVEIPSDGRQFYGTGRRKTSVARVFLRPGSGEMVVNGRKLEEYFPTVPLRNCIYQPLQAVELMGKFSLMATVQGGGLTGQAGSIRLGIARALLEYDLDLRKKLKKLGFLTRDPRTKERKKYGQKGARKRFQFSKR